MRLLPQWLIRSFAVVGVMAILAVLVGFERVILSPADAACKKITVNPSGVGSAGVTVDATAGGVIIMAASTTRCNAAFYALQGGGDVLCGPSTITVTSTVGFYIAAGQNLGDLGLAAQEQWKCIRQGATNGTVYVATQTP